MAKKPITRDKLLKDISNFCRENSISFTEFGSRALADPGFYTRLKKGRSPTLERIEKVYDFMDNQGAANDIWA